MIQHLKNHWLFYCILVFLLLLNLILILPLKSLPSPIYGGDYYYQLGQLNNYLNGGNIIHSASIVNSLPIYFISYTFFTGTITKMLGIEAIAGTFITSFFVLAISSILLYILGNLLFKSKVWACILVLMIINCFQLPLIKYTEFAKYLMIPLFFIIFYLYHELEQNKRIILALAVGIIYGIIGLTHSIAFIGISLFLLLFSIYELITSQKRLKTLINYGIIAIIGISIAMIYWWNPIFIHHGVTSLHYNEYNNQNWGSLYVSLGFIKDTFVKYFFNFISLKGIIFSIFTIIGVSSFIFIREKTIEKKFIKISLIISAIILMHYWITQPLLHLNFMSNYLDYFLFELFIFIAAIFGIKQLIDCKEKFKKIIMFALIGLLVGLSFLSFLEKSNEQWYQQGKNLLPEQYIALSYYLNDNSNVTDVILTSKELGFAVNALTGRKLVVSRRAHNDAFLNVEERELDAALILYGNNTQLRIELLQKYNIKYVYWDYYWINSEWTIQNNQIIGWYDPLIMFNNVTYEQILKQNNVTYFNQYTYVDPALKGKGYKQFNLTFIAPQYRSFETPWTADLDNYLKEVWKYQQNGQVIARLYEVKI